MLGTKLVEAGPCLYLALEDSPRRLRGLVAGEGEAGSAQAPEGLEFATEWPRVGEGCEERLRARLESHPGARLVVVDTLKKVRPKTDVRKGVYDADYEALEPLLPLAAEFGVAVVVVHHTRKTPGADPLEEVSGSYGLSGGVDGVLVMKRERGSREAFLHVTGRDVEEEAELALRWDASLLRWALLEDAEDHRRSEERKQIIAKLDLDTRLGDERRFVQLTPPGSGCSVQLSSGILNMPPGVLEGLQLVVSDVEAARAELVERGVQAGPVQHMDDGEWVEGRGGEWNSFVFFSDPDGNGWILQERPARD